MSYHEKRSIVYLFASMFIYAIFWFYFLRWGPAPEAIEAEPAQLFRFWGIFFVVLIPAQILAHIGMHILFSIINTITTDEEEPEVEDERDKMIELRADRNSNNAFMIGFLVAMVALALGRPPATMFVLILSALTITALVNYISTFIYYRRGF